MNSPRAIACCFLALSPFADAAPRLIVSSPSITPESSVQFVFERPMVANGDLGKSQPNKAITVSPELPGTLVWKSPTVAEFKPARLPLMGETYHFSVPEKTASLDGTALPPGEFASAATESFGARSASSPERWSSSFKPSVADWQIRFNDAVSPDKVAGYIAFFGPKGERVGAVLRTPALGELGPYGSPHPTWAARAETAAPNPPPPDTPASTVLIATPEKPLPPLGKWELVVVRGCPNQSGSAATPKDVRYDAGTVLSFEVTSSGAVTDVNEPREIAIGFSQVLPDPLPADFLDRAVVLKPRPANLTATCHDSTLVLKGDFNGADKYDLTIRPPFASAVGHPLAKTYVQELVFEHLKPVLALPTRDQAQLANGSRIYRFRTINLAEVRIRVKKLTPADAMRVLETLNAPLPEAKEGGEPRTRQNVPFALLNGDIVFDQSLPLSNPVDTSKDISLDWSKVLPASLRDATLFLEVAGTPKAKLHLPPSAAKCSQALVQLTDIGLAWKLSRGEALIYAFSCTTGAAMPGVALSLYGDDAKPLADATTDSSGLARLARPDGSRALLARAGGDAFVTEFAYARGLSTVDMWRFPVESTWQDLPAAMRQVFMFTDRSLYRPGETVRLKGMVRVLRGNSYELEKPGRARMTVIDPTETEIHSRDVDISATGSFDFAYTLPQSGTGTHIFRLEYPDELAAAEKLDDWEEKEAITNYARFDTQVEVEDFRRNSFDVAQAIASPPVGATRVDVSLSAQYYQGQPVANGSVVYQARVAEQNLYPERFRDYLFGNHRSEDPGYWSHYFNCRWDEDGDSGGTRLNESSEGEAMLDASGKASLVLPLPKSDFPTGRSVRLSSETTDANNQTLSAFSSATVHPAEIYVGVSRVDGLVRAGEPLELRLVAVTPDGQPLASDAKVTTLLTREVNSATKSRNDDGETTTQNDRSEETVTTGDLVISAAASAGGGSPLTIHPVRTGLHFLTVRGTDAAGREFATCISFNVYGTDEFPWLYEDGLRVKLVAGKNSYKPGETARILVLSPIEGTALVTVEREKVLRSFITRLTTANPVIDIPITDDDAPYACVSVLIVKGLADSTRKFKQPQLRLGYCALNVTDTRDRLAVTLDASGPGSTRTGDIPTFRPGGQVGFSGTVSFADGKPAANAEVTLYAEDEGTLAVMGYTTPDPFAFFYGQRYLQVLTGTSFETFLTENPDGQLVFDKGYEVGGAGRFGDLADLLRKNFDPCATWAPALITDSAGRFTHSCTLPDTLTRYRVIAVAQHGAARFGSTQSAIIANKPLMLEAKAPRFANQGDTLVPRVLVQNASPYQGSWKVTYQVHAGDGPAVCHALGQTEQTVTLAPGASASLAFPTVFDATGEAVSIWNAEPVSITGTDLDPALARSLSDSVQARYSVNYPVPLLRQATYMKIGGPVAGENLLGGLDPALLAGGGTLDVSLSTSPLAGASGPVDFLLHYPHGCVEQTTSALMPWLAAGSLRPFVPALAGVPPERVRNTIAAGVDRLLTMQTADGSFAYWPGATTGCDWATSYAGLALILAKQQGIDVPDSAIAKLTGRLIARLRDTKKAESAWERDIHARDLWVLALAGKPQPAYQNTLRERPGVLSSTGRSFLALAISQSGKKADLDAAREILKAMGPGDEAAGEWMPGDIRESIRLLALVHLDPGGAETAAALDKLLNDRNPYGHCGNTWSNGWAVLALGDYARLTHAAEAAANVTLDTATGPQQITLSPSAPSAVHNIRLTPGMKLALSSDAPVFVRLRLAAKPKITPLKPVTQNGLAIDRFYERVKSDGSAETLSEPAVGDLVKITLRITLPDDGTRYLVIDDPLPAVFETVNNNFASQRSITQPGGDQNSWSVSHAELRNDRALFYIDWVPGKGAYSVSYLARCTLAGEATAPQAKVEPMYDPSSYALSASRHSSAK